MFLCLCKALAFFFHITHCWCREAPHHKGYYVKYCSLPDVVALVSFTTLLVLLAYASRCGITPTPSVFVKPRAPPATKAIPRAQNGTRPFAKKIAR